MPSTALPHNSPAPARETGKLRVLIVDDSLVARRVLARILDEDGRFEVAGSYSNADEALAALPQQQVDIILLDLEMPGRSGVETLPEFLRAAPDAAVVILSGHHAIGGAVAVEALARGARDMMTKPAAGHFGAAFGCALTDRLIAVVTGRDKMSWTGSAAPRRPAERGGLVRAPHAIGIGASTGGIHAINDFFQALDTAPPAPIFLTQHLPPDFLPFFAEQLTRQTRLPVHLAQEGMPALPGHVYVAAGHAHLAVRRASQRHVELYDSRVSSRHGSFPAVDPMFASLAEVYGAGACGIVFSGMGRDGLTGAEAIVSAGGSVIAQDSASSVVWGMPGAVVQAGIACLTSDPREAARALLDSWRRLAA